MWSLLFCCTLPAFAQTVIKGKVTDKTNKPISDISVMLMLPADSTVVAYGFSDNKGDYSLSYSGESGYLLISISAFEIKRQVKRVENKSQTVNFTTEEGSIDLREVLVEPLKIWGQKDTLNYSVAAFKDKKDVVIGDVLKKMPGIDVSEGGQISYKGKPINKFYIENLDMLQGRYGIATNNISANDVATVQVLENHQPIKALDKTRFSDSAAINLKIKEGKKGVFSMAGVAGLGIDRKLLWQEELMGMYFSKVRQHIFTYKTNNNGTDVNRELRSFTAENPIEELRMTDIRQPAPPAIRFERYNFNTTHAGTANSLFKLKNDAELTANVIYSNNEDRRHSFARTSYILPGEETRVIEEDISALSRTNTLETEFRYNLNKPSNYFNNYLNISGSWDDISGEVNTGRLIGQRLDNKSLFAHNVTHWIKKGQNEKGIELLTRNACRTQPHHLRIAPGLYPDLINGGKAYASLSQNVRHSAFVSKTRLSLLSTIVLRDLRIDPGAILDLEHQSLRSDMEVMENSDVSHLVRDTSMRNDITWSRLNTGVSIDANCHRNRLKLNLFMPLTYRYTVLPDRPTDGKGLSVGKVYFEPRMSAMYMFTNRLEAYASAGYYAVTPGLETLYTGYILQDYRNINKYDTHLFDSNRLFASLGLSYKDILEMLFVGGGASFSRYHREGLYAQTFDNLLSVTRLTMQPNTGYSLSANGRISKGFDWKALVLTIEGSWGKATSEQMRQNKLVTYESQWANATASFNMKLFRWFFADYKLSWARSKGQVSSGELFTPIQSLSQRARLDISLPLDMSLSTSWEHYYNSAILGNKHFYLADLGLTYIDKGVRYSLEWTNIFDTSKYISTSYGALNSYYSEYDIRPMAVMLKVRFKLL